MAPPRRPPVTARDQELLAFLAVHRVVRTDHVQALLEVGPPAARDRLRRVGDAELAVGEQVIFGQPACWRITRRGLKAIGSRLPAPGEDLGGLTHDVGVAWLWIAARAGAFGGLRELYAERELRSLDRPGARSEVPLAVRVGGAGPGGGERLHYPDLVLVSDRGERVAFELELSSKPPDRRELILSAYGADPGIDHLVYFVRDRHVGAAIAASARKLGIEDLVRVQRVTLADPTLPRGPARVPVRSARRTRGVQR